MKKRKFILGSDWWTDCDDAVAIRLLGKRHLAGSAELLGIVINACMPFSLQSLDVFLADMGLLLPIALDRDATDFGRRPPYQEHLAQRPSRFSGNEDAESPVRLYRRLLAQHGEVEILEIGYPQMLAALLESGPDEFSPLSGRELVAQCVPRLWIMAGNWSGDGKRENNFCRNQRASQAAAKLCALWPAPITFLGYEAGYSVISGSQLHEGDLLKQVLTDHGSPNGRSSWDPMLVDLALTGDPESAGYRTVRGYASVLPEDGSNFFRRDLAGPHEFVEKLHPDPWYAQRIDRQIDFP